MRTKAQNVLVVFISKSRELISLLDTCSTKSGEWVASDLYDTSNEQNSIVLVAGTDSNFEGAIYGYQKPGWVPFESGQSGSTAFIEDLVVQDTSTSRRVVEGLCAGFYKEAKEKGFKDVILETYEGNEWIPLLESLGFEDTGINTQLSYARYFRKVIG